MKKTFSVMLLFITLITTGCNLEHNSRVKQSQLMGEIKTIETTLRVEVPSCTNYQDKTKPSNELLKTNDLIKKLFAESEYEGCKNENMKSMATYIAPMEVGTLPPDSKEFETKGVSLLRNQSGVVFFCLSKKIRAQIAEGRKNSMANNLTLNVNIRLSNDTEKDSKVYPYAVFAGGHAFAGLPEWGNNITVKAKESIVFRLSDVASEFAIAQGIAPVYKEPVPEDDKK